MRKLIARVFDYSLDGLIATEDTAFFQFCRDLPDDPAEEVKRAEFYADADVHIMGRVAYQSMASYFPTATDDPTARPSTPRARWCSPARSRSPTGPTPPSPAATWARRSTSSAEAATVTSSPAAASARWRSLARLDLIDEYRVTLVPYLAGQGTRLFEDVGQARSLDLLSTTAFSSGLKKSPRRHH